MLLFIPHNPTNNKILKSWIASPEIAVVGLWYLTCLRCAGGPGGGSGRVGKRLKGGVEIKFTARSGRGGGGKRVGWPAISKLLSGDTPRPLSTGPEHQS